jgi:pimeloyl-ACP methyl ester carboxylesterase
MKRWELALALAGAILIALGAHWIRQGQLPRRDILIAAANCHTPVTIFDPPADVASAGSIIVIHGLSANRRIMFYLGQDFAGHGIRAYLLDLPGHGDNTDPFSFSRAEECARVTAAALIRRDSLNPERTILLGHSMGGEIAIRMADKIPLAATIAISPAPMVLPRRMPANLLVFSAQFDVWALIRQADALQQAAGGVRSAPDDFAQQRAFDLVNVPLATHTSMLDDRAVAHRSELWAMQTLLPPVDPKTLALNLDLSTYGTFASGRLRLAGAIFGLVGIGMILPLCIAITAKAAGENAQSEAPRQTPTPLLVFAEVALAGVAAVLLLMFFVPLQFVHIYAGDYLISAMLIVAVVLLALNRDAARQIWNARIRALIVVAAFAVVATLAIGAWLNLELTDLWLNAPRWLRLLELLPFTFLFCYAEQAVLGPVNRGRQRAQRFCAFLGLRLEIWLACLLAFFVLASGQILLPILVMQFAAFSIAQGLATDALLRRTGSPTAAALFGAILAAWFVAAVFPIT